MEIINVNTDIMKIEDVQPGTMIEYNGEIFMVLDMVRSDGVFNAAKNDGTLGFFQKGTEVTIVYGVFVRQR